MTTDSLNHPPKDQLIAFGQGKLAADESSSVEQHLEVCRECCETLLDLKDDTFVGLVKIAQPSIAVPDPPRWASVRTDPGADASCVGHDSAHSATLLVQSGEAVCVEELPAELQDHPRYRIVELIGRGGMGNVYRAEHRLMNRPVAIKLINSQLIRQPQAVERFRREVQAAAKLTHPNIVTAYDAEQAGEVHFLVMEFVEGTDLASVVKHRGPMSVVEACECIRQAAEGLQHAHEKGMVHRDIKPHNLMLSAEGQVRILDFGLAGFVTESVVVDAASVQTSQNADAGSVGHGHLTMAGSVMGTPDYIAPEQAKDAHSADIRADIYSLGCTLHFLLTGKPPFVSDSIIAKLKAHAELVPESLTKLRGDVPQELSNVVARMMAKKAAERFQTPAAVAEALAPFAKPAASPPKRRARTLVAVLCMGVAALLAGVIFVQTSKGRVEIQSEVDGVEVVIKQGGEQIDVIDITTGSQVTLLPSGDYELKLNGDRNDVEIKGGNFKLSRWGKVIVTLNRKPEANGVAAKHDKKSRPKDIPPRAIAPFDAEQAKKHQEAWAKHLGVPVEYKNSIGMKFVLIPPGEYMMGSTPAEIEEALKIADDNEFAQRCAKSEGPQHKVILSQPRYVGIYEVTQAQYEKVMGKNPSHFSVTGPGKDAVAGLDTTNHPVEMVSWHEAVAFCAKLSQQEKQQPDNSRRDDGATQLNGVGYRLLTEAEWEFSCRAGSTMKYSSGDGDEQLDQIAWIGRNSANRTHAVGELQANPFGMHDLQGNVWEWCQDPWELTYYGQFQEQPALDPNGPPPKDDAVRVMRGSAWPFPAFACRASYRHTLGALVRLEQIGFRVSLPVDAVRQAMKGQVVVELLGQEERNVLKAAEAFLAVADEENFDKLYDLGSNLAKKQAKREQVVPLYQQIRDTAGKVENRTLQRVRLIDEFLGLPPGRYAAVQYVSDFEKHKGLWETVMLNVDDDGKWRPNTYAATVQPLPLPEPKKAPTKGASSTGSNLITDPSFENTGLTQLPRDWRAWHNDGSDFRCEVVNGGHTGQRSLQISGKGTRGVVFGNDLKADRTKRYALKGWAKFEGDKDARAIIKFNYFRGSEFLGVHDLVGVTADQPGWHLFEKTDALDAYPQADHFYAMCHVEGSGSGWFDDLELVAYDRDKLPTDFDSRHGRHNRLTGPNSLDRWVGAWETEYAFREFDNSPNETRLTMNTASERTLGDYFLLSHAKKIPLASGAASAPRSGDDNNTGGLTPPRSPEVNGGNERLLFLTFDQNLGAFRQWFFSSNGKAFEWRGPWDDATKSLELRMLPDASNLFSSERFVDADHIEAKLRFQYVMGMKDAGRWTATRKAAIAKVDVPTAKSHVAEPAELSQLNKFAGEWTIRAKYKPSVWNPLPREETIRETSVWILGGRFLMTRAFNEKDELTSIWIATYEPMEKSNRFWFFNADGSRGEWRLTWDEASSGFHFRAIDMPTGWTGTGFNRWVNDDTFDNQATIKDETGRVMLDMTQDKRRKN